MATYNLPLSGANFSLEPLGDGRVGYGLFWNVTAEATLQGWTLAVSDSIQTPVIDLHSLGIGGFRFVDFCKITDVSNADAMWLFGDHQVSMATGAYLPTSFGTAAGAAGCYAASAGNFVRVIGNPHCSYVRGTVSIATSVPATFRIRMGLYRF
jgi:hypothetical protein